MGAVRVLLVAALVLLVCAPAAQASPEGTMLRVVNNWRVNHDLHRVRTNVALRDASRYWTKHLLVTDTFRHGNVGKRLHRYYDGYRRWSVGEVLAWRTEGNVRAVFRGWLSSASHRYIISRGRWRDVGIDVRVGLFKGNWVWMWCIDFGRRWG